VRYNWPTSAHASQAFSIANCTESENLPIAHVINVIVDILSYRQISICIFGGSGTSAKAKTFGFLNNSYFIGRLLLSRAKTKVVKAKIMKMMNRHV